MDLMLEVQTAWDRFADLGRQGGNLANSPLRANWERARAEYERLRALHVAELNGEVPDNGETE